MGRILSEKNYGVRGYFLKKKEALLTKERKQPPVVILKQSNFYNIFIRCLWLRIIRGSAEGVQFTDNYRTFLHRYFLTLSIMVTEQLYLRKVLCDCSRPIWLWLLVTVMKRCAERCALQLYCTSLSCHYHLPGHCLLHSAIQKFHHFQFLFPSSEVVTQRCSVKKVQKSRKIHRKTTVPERLL